MKKTRNLLTIMFSLFLSIFKVQMFGIGEGGGNAEVERYFSNDYEGDINNFEDEDYEGDLYDGYEDETLSFGGQAGSFRNEGKQGVTFAFKLVNATGSSMVVALWPGFFNRDKVESDGKGGYQLAHTNITQLTDYGFSDCTAVLSDGVIAGTGTTTLTATALRGKIEDFINFTTRNPTRIPKVTIQSNGTNAYERSIRIHKISPFRKFGDQIINLTDYFKVTQYQDKKIEVPTGNFGLQFDDQTAVFMELDSVVTGTATPMEVILTLYIGAIKNQAGELFNKSARATANIQGGKPAMKVAKQSFIRRFSGRK